MPEGEWPSSVDQFPLEKKIGQGAFATVWKATCPAKANMAVAIKIMDLENINSSFEDIRQEVQMMRMADHPNILRCYCSFVHDCQLWLVTQMMEKGSCLHVISLAKRLGMGEGLREDWLAYILRETLQGLKYFHDQGQIHRDIKAGNILLDGEGNVRLADFGVSGWLINSGDRRQTTKTFVGTPCWMAPEVMEQVDGYDYKCDVWSVGITALELAKGYAPYAHFAPMKVLIMTIQQEPPSLKSYPDDRSVDGEPFSRGFREIVRLCLQKVRFGLMLYAFTHVDRAPNTHQPPTPPRVQQHRTPRSAPPARRSSRTSTLPSAPRTRSSRSASTASSPWGRGNWRRPRASPALGLPTSPTTGSPPCGQGRAGRRRGAGSAITSTRSRLGVGAVGARRCRNCPRARGSMPGGRRGYLMMARR